MNVVRLDNTHANIYSQFVAAHKSGSFLQSWSWGEFQNELGKAPIRYGAFDERTNLIASVQFSETTVPHLKGRYLYSAYGPLIEQGRSDVQRICDALIAKVKIDFPSLWFIRIEPKDDLPIAGKPSVHIQPGSTLTTDLSVSTEELLAGMHHKTRYNIKVAEKHGVTVNSQPQDMNDAIALLVKTSDRQGYKSYPAAYYEKLINFFSDQNTQKHNDCRAFLYSASHNGPCIASAIMIDHGQTRTYLFGGSNNEHRNLMAPYALHWTAMRDAKYANLTNYDWWGIETATGSTPGFVQFKLRWGGTQKFYSGARDIVLNDLWYRAYTALRKINRVF